MDIETAVSEYVKNFDGGMGDVLEAFMRQMGESIKESFRAGWNARQDTKVAEQAPTNSAMDAISALRDLLDVIDNAVKYHDVGLSKVGLEKVNRAKDVLKLHQ